MYNLADIKASKKIQINTECAIVFVINDNPKYFHFLQQAISNITSLHKVDIYILCLNCKEQISELLKTYSSENLHLLDIDFYEDTKNLESKFVNKFYEFQYIKPIAFDTLIKYIKNNEINKKYFLYLDTDTFPIRNIDQLFNDIHTQLLIIKELGIDYNALGYEKYLNSLSIYNYFDIPIENRWGRREPIINTGVIGFDIDRDYDIIYTWLDITKTILSKNLRRLVKWWDQGCFMLALELLNKKHIISDNKNFNHTILFNHLHQGSIPDTTANIIHFIGDKKINILNAINKEEIDSSFLEIAVTGHVSEQFSSMHPKSYLSYKILPELNYTKEIYKENSLGESRIFLAKDVFNEHSEVIGSVTASWNRKYYPNKIDQILNWPQLPVIQRIRHDPSLVICATICSGAYSRRHDPLWIQNFQVHFRNEFKNSQWVEEKLFNITGLRYDGIRPAPYANQIICHKTLFYELCSFMRNHIDSIIDEFSLTPPYDTPDPNRPLAYILEELTMLWWASRKDIQLVPTVEIQPNWYKK